MTRNQAVLLVSRALAAIQFISALEELSYLPDRLFSLQHYGGSILPTGPSYVENLYRLETSTLLFRIGGLLALAWLFWNCGPRIAQILLPGSSTTSVAAPDEAGSVQS